MMGGDQGSLAERSTFRAAAQARTPTRDDNIAAARADGTFDAKRAAFNSANKGSHMDEMGRIGPKAPAAPGTNAPAMSAPAAPMSPPGQSQAKPMTPPKTGMAAAASGKFTSMPPGSRDLYAEEKARNAKAQETPADAAMNKQVAALQNAATIANSPETAATMAKAKSILEKKPTTMTAAAKPSASPAGVPPPAESFTKDQADGYNKAMASLSESPKPSAPGMGAPSDGMKAETIKGLPPIAAPASPPPQGMAAKAAAPRPVTGPPSAPIPGKTQAARAVVGGAQGMAQAASLPSRAVTAPITAAQSVGTAAGVAAKVGAKAVQAGAKNIVTAAKNWWETGEATPKKKGMVAAASR